MTEHASHQRVAPHGGLGHADESVRMIMVVDTGIDDALALALAVRHVAAGDGRT